MCYISLSIKEHILHKSKALAFVLETLSAVGRSWCNTLKMKLDSSDPSPCSLDLLHTTSQFVVGLINSAGYQFPALPILLVNGHGHLVLHQ